MYIKKMSKSLIVIGILFIVSIIFSGCGTIVLQTFAKSSNSIFFESLKPQKTIFLINKNSSQVDSKIGKLTREDLIKKGYEMVNSPDKAQFILRINKIQALTPFLVDFIGRSFINFQFIIQTISFYWDKTAIFYEVDKFVYLHTFGTFCSSG